MPRKKYQPPKEVQPGHEEFFKKIGEKLKGIREEKGISFNQIAKELNMSRNSFPMLEDGKIYFNTQTLLKVLDYYKVDPEEFFKGL